jgi:hypothetical protein
MAGPARYPGDLLNVYSGQNDRVGPVVVLARTDSLVADVVLHTEPRGNRQMRIFSGPAELGVSVAMQLVERTESLRQVIGFDESGREVAAYDLSRHRRIDPLPPPGSFGWRPDSC